MNDQNKQQTWEFVSRLEAGGHRVFRHRLSGALAIVDNSGHYPDEADDGILWIRKRTIWVAGRARRGLARVRVIVAAENVSLWRKTVALSLPAAVKLARIMGVKLRIRLPDGTKLKVKLPKGPLPPPSAENDKPEYNY